VYSTVLQHVGKIGGTVHNHGCENVRSIEEEILRDRKKTNQSKERNKRKKGNGRKEK
jgi:hypothetical protein